jgi:hypothetical protein
MAKLTMAKSKILLTRDLLFYPVLATFTIRNYLGIGEKNGFRLISGGIIHLYVLINIFELYLLFHDMSDFYSLLFCFRHLICFIFLFDADTTDLLAFMLAL